MSIPELYFTSRAEWRDWLASNHERNEKGIWLVYCKKESGLPSLGYDESVEEALCFGWVDSLIRKLDEQRFVRKFTPRKENSLWSDTNKMRVARLIEKGLMQEPGLGLVEAARKNGLWDKTPIPPRLEFGMHAEFSKALQENSKAGNNFENLAPGHQKQYLAWINHARRDATRTKRIKEAIALLKRGEKLGLK